MQHLKETEFIDLLDGALEAGREAHVTGCRECRARLETLRAALVSIQADAAHEPSPLFWNAFPQRVSAAIETAPRASWWANRPVLAALGCAAALLIVLSGFAVWSSSDGNEVDQMLRSATAEKAAVPGSVLPEDDVEEDAAWAVVRTAAGDLDYEDALAAGISAGPGATERAAMELTAEERAELVRLIEREIRRTGA